MSNYKKQIIDSLKNKYNNNVKHYNTDLVISGGGCSGYYFAGTCNILNNLEKLNKIHINNIYATSAGVLIAIFYLCQIPIEKWIQTYYYAKFNYKSGLIHDVIIKTLKQFIPRDAYLKCNKILNIILSKRTLFGFKKTIINTFSSNDELLLVVSAAINVPFITSYNVRGVKINNDYYYDGVLVCNTPIQYNSSLPQLVLYTHKIDYPLKYKFSINDDLIELLMIRGYIETEEFLNSLENNSKTICWIDKNLERKEKPNRCFYVVNILTIGIYIFMNYK